jgi:hypothetical protein
MIMKKGDLLPALVINCTSNGTAVDLTGASSVQVICRNEAGTTIFTRSAAGTAQGVVTYTWQVGDTTTVGRMLFEVLVTWPGSKPQHFPANSQLPVDIEDP